MTSNLEAKFSQPQRLHPIAMVFSLFHTIRELIFEIGIGLLLTLRESFVFFAVFGIGLFLFLIVFSVLRWYRFTYYIEGDELRIEQGVFVRKKRYISIHRIHKIDITANILHRPFQLVQVQIDTASNSDEAEVSLRAIREREARELRQLLQQEKSAKVSEEPELEQTFRQITWKRLFFAGTTSGSVGIILLALLTFLSQIEDLIPRDYFNVAFHWLVGDGGFRIFGLLAFFIFLLWIFGIAGTMLRYGGFRIEKGEKELFVKRGLLERKELTIPFDRIQAIGVEQSPIRQPFGYVTVFAVVAGGSFDQLEEFPVLFPMLHQREVDAFLREFVPDYSHRSINAPLHRLPKKSVSFFIAKALVYPLLLLFILLYFIPSLYWLAIVFLLANLILSMFQYKDSGYHIKGEGLTLQRRSLNKLTLYTKKNRIQALEKRTHKLQSLFQVASVTISLINTQGMGSHYSLAHLREEEANKIAGWFSYRKEKPLEKEAFEVQSVDRT